MSPPPPPSHFTRDGATHRVSLPLLKYLGGFLFDCVFVAALWCRGLLAEGEQT